MWDKQIIDFGTVKVNTPLEAKIKYLGTNDLTQEDFKTSCTCTKCIFNPIDKTLELSLKNEGIGDTNTFITVFPDNKNSKGEVSPEHYILLKSMIVL